MPVIRPDIREISPYRPGPSINDVARDLGRPAGSLIKLASNESPFPPFPGALEALRSAVESSHRYPDNEARELRTALSVFLGVPPDHLWFGAGSSEILRVAALAVGGPGTAAVYPWPSFGVYRLASTWAMEERREVALDPVGRIDVDALASAVTPTTRILYLCNPNNPTGTLVPSGDVARLVDALPDSVLLMIDEAYHEYVTEPGHTSAIPLAIERSNVLVTRTFSKVFGLAALRVGYAVGRPETIAELRKAQAPFTVPQAGQAAAASSLTDREELQRRVGIVKAGRSRIESALRAAGIEYLPSQANFVTFRRGRRSADDTAAGFLAHGVILRAFEEGWVRATVGSTYETDRLLEALATTLREPADPTTR